MESASAESVSLLAWLSILLFISVFIKLDTDLDTYCPDVNLVTSQAQPK